MLAVASDAEKAGPLLASAQQAHVNVELLGVGGSEGYGHDWKLRLVEAAVQDLAPDQLVVVLDAYDALVSPTLGDAEFLQSFEAFDAPIVFAAERSCWPDPALCETFGPYLNGGETSGPYLNAGAIAGSAGDVSSMLAAIREFGAFAFCGGTDQRAYQRYVAARPVLCGV